MDAVSNGDLLPLLQGILTRASRSPTTVSTGQKDEHLE
jgi:hypothetical protein